MLTTIKRWLGLEREVYQVPPKPVTVRSPEWPRVEKEHLKLEPVCQVCSTKDNLEVHHVEPFHLYPEKELDPKNLITLCRPHHFLFGHLCGWSKVNVNCRDDCALWMGKIKAR